ncbi:MAG: phosphotransferase [Microbacteriaceae bacterium]
MTRSQLTLAALATAAVPGLEVSSATVLPGSSADFYSVLLTASDGHHLKVQAPKRQSAENRQSAELVALGALTEGVRNRLPFEIPSLLGKAPYGPSRVVVFSYVYGHSVQANAVLAGSALAEHLGQAIAAIHSLPASVVSQAGLIHYTAADCRTQTLTLLDRALDTGKVPAVIEERWQRISTDVSLWQFQATVIHAGLSAENILAIGDDITGILNWSGLKVADPALDLSWVMTGLHPDAAESVLDAYAQARGVMLDEALRKRTALYAELELARWLLHGVDSKDESIVEDAISMLHSLLDRVQYDLNNPLNDNEHQPLSETQVHEYLNHSGIDRPDTETDAIPVILPLNSPHGEGLSSELFEDSSEDEESSKLERE